MLRPSAPRFIAFAAATLLPFANIDAQSTSVADRDSAGIRIVESRAPAWPQGKGWKVDRTPTLSIGNETDAAYQFNYVAGAVRLSNGRIVVADAGSLQLRMFDSTGRHLKTFGRSGSGPGEFRQIDALFLLPGDTIAVSNLRTSIELFAPDGKYVKTISIRRPSGVPLVTIIGFTDRGEFLAYVRIPTSTAAQGGGAVIDSALVIRFAADGSARETVKRIAKFSGEMFGPFGWAATRKDGFYSAYSATPQIGVYSPTGQLLKLLRKPWKSASVSASDIQRFKAYDRATRKTFTGKPLTAAENLQRDSALANMRFAKEFALFAQGWTDRSDNLWVRHYELQHVMRTAVDAPSTYPFHYSVFSPNGRWLGDIELPANLVVYEAGADYLLGVSKDAEGVESVVLHRLRK